MTVADAGRTDAATSAVSLDGRRFQFRGTVDQPFEPGDFVSVLDPSGRQHVGQVDEVTFTMEGSLRGTGRIFGVTDDAGAFDARRSAPFSSGILQRADADTIDLVFEAADLGIGGITGTDAVSARLLSKRFNRHTFWCGQSGSGKTYALGVLLEQLLLHTALPMVVFDPNADFVRIHEPNPNNPTMDPAASEVLASRDIRVLRPRVEGSDGLRVRFTAMSMPSRAAVLRLDPLTHRQEYNELLHLEERLGSIEASQIVPTLAGRNVEAATALQARIENLRTVDWSIWAGEHEAATEILDRRPDATVLDIGGFTYPEEHLVVALAVLDDLWAKRESRRPLLIVIDEAHNLCSPEGTSPLQTAVRERIIQIAAEGRKFGLWLLLSTQRPSKIHPGIISQCDNLVLMKMNSPLDLAELGEIFGYAPPGMLARAPQFRQGEGLFAGGFVPAPVIVSVNPRFTREGGIDVDVPSRSTEVADA
ncbi:MULTISPECIES: ATP-binding protein [unclassified Leifsonia]|uniref:ATP-binding protein n=1 Tax=unclassified Leifsonia TaxID=2663824 RepID=UPI0009EB8518|nr:MULTISPECIES: ATP-binding protein [unclassified Leifsonia]